MVWLSSPMVGYVSGGGVMSAASDVGGRWCVVCYA